MAMFGASRLRNPYNAPGYGMDGGFPPETMPENPIALPPNPFGQEATQPALQGMMASPKKPGFGDPGGWGERLGAIGSILLNTAGVQDDGYDQFLQIKRMRAEDQRKQQLAEAARYAPQEVGGNIVAMQPDGSYKTLYKPDPKPANNDTANDYEFYRQKFGPEFADNWLKFNAANVRQPDGTYVSAASGWGNSTPLPALPPGITVDPQPTGGPTPSASGTFQPSALMPALINTESSGKRGVLGPMTKWGQAKGLAQVLDGTGADMAKKIGLPWRPDLMTGKSDQAAQYQTALGQAYLEQGYAATGNARDALRYYHGGPNRRQWGPKTNAYADTILRRTGGN